MALRYGAKARSKHQTQVELGPTCHICQACLENAEVGSPRTKGEPFKSFVSFGCNGLCPTPPLFEDFRRWTLGQTARSAAPSLGARGPAARKGRARCGGSTRVAESRRTWSWFHDREFIFAELGVDDSTDFSADSGCRAL